MLQCQLVDPEIPLILFIPKGTMLLLFVPFVEEMILTIIMLFNSMQNFVNPINASYFLLRYYSVIFKIVFVFVRILRIRIYLEIY